MAGYSADITLSAGEKRYQSDEAEGIEQNTDQFAAEWKLQQWIPFKNRLSFGVRWIGGMKLDDALQLNESYRIGGLNTLRGFDEESIFATGYSVLTSELKYRLDQSSALFIFFDQGWYERNLDDYLRDTPFGFGLGVILGTRNGGFRFVYGLGEEQNNPILIRNGKLHFGFINRF